MLGAIAFLYTLIGGSALAISAASDKARKNSVDRAIRATKDRREEMERMTKAVCVNDPYGSEKYVKAVEGVKEDMYYLLGDEVASKYYEKRGSYWTKEYPGDTLREVERLLYTSRFCGYKSYGACGFPNLEWICMEDGYPRKIIARVAAMMERNYRNFGIYMDFRFVMRKAYDGSIRYDAVPVCELGAPIGISVLDHPINADIKQLVIQDGHYKG